MKRIAVDTNILARLLADVPGSESEYAERLLASGKLFITKSVLLETEWVLRTALRVQRGDITRMLKSILRIRHVEIEQRPQVALAVLAFENGMDFADALHVASAEDVDAFVTFDRDLVKLARLYINHVSVELAP